MKDSHTGIVFDGKTIAWARAERARSGFAQTASGSCGAVPQPLQTGDAGTAAHDLQTYEAEVEAYARGVSAKIKDTATPGIPSTDIIFRCAKLPSADKDEIAAMTANQIERDAPLPMDEMVYAFEIVSADDTSALVISAAAPIVCVERVRRLAGADPDAVERVDLAALGMLRNLRDKAMLTGEGREVVLFEEGENLTLIITDMFVPLAIRSVGAVASIRDNDLVQPVRMALIQAQVEHGQAPITRVAVVSDSAPIGVAGSALANSLGCEVKHLNPASVPGAAFGVAVRTATGCAFNLFPGTWTELLNDRRFKRRFRNSIVAGVAGWVLLAGCLYGRPALIDYANKNLTKEIEQRSKAAGAVEDIRTRIRIIEKYSDRTYSAPEMLLEATLALPPPKHSVTFSRFTYNALTRTVTVEGRANTPTLAYDFMDRLKESDLFGENKLASGPTYNAQLRKHAFTLNIPFKATDADTNKAEGAQ